MKLPTSFLPTPVGGRLAYPYAAGVTDPGYKAFLQGDSPATRLFPGYKDIPRLQGDSPAAMPLLGWTGEPPVLPPPAKPASK